MSATPEMINVVFYVVLLGISAIFGLLALTFKSKDTEEAWKAPVFSGLSFVFWLTLGTAHLSVAASFSQELIGLAYLWYGLGIFFLVYTFVLIFQTLKAVAEAKKWTV